MDIQQLIKQAGNQSALARAFGVSRMAVTYWVQSGKLPESRVWQLQAGAVKLPEKPLQAITGEGTRKV